MSGESDDYDEFGMLGDSAAETGLTLASLPPVTRASFTLADGQVVSALAWGDAQPELVLLHGGGQNAHTWDTVALALGRPLLAIDLPGHGHSARRGDRDYGRWRNAEAVASVIEQAAPAAVADHTGLWGDVSAITVPLLLVLGADSQFTGEQDVAEFLRRLPAARVEVVPGAGHAIQSDQPLALAGLISDFVAVESDY